MKAYARALGTLALQIRRSAAAWLIAAGLGVAAPAWAQVPPTYSEQALRADLDFLLSTLRDVHPAPFTNVTATRFETRRAAVSAALRDGMSKLEFYRLTAPLVAELGDGHTFMQIVTEEWSAWTGQGGLLFPFEVELRDRRMFVTRSYGSPSITPGAEITAIDGQPMNQILESLLPYSIGERDGFRLAVIQQNIHIFVRLVLGYGGAYRIAAVRDGAPREITVQGVPGPVVWNARNAPSGDGANEDPARFEVLAGNVGYLRVSRFEEAEQSARLYRRAFETARRRGLTDFVIDLRGNEGGDSLIGDDLLGYVADRPVAQASRIDVKISRQIHDFYRDPSQANRRAWHYEEIMQAPVGEVLAISEAPVVLHDEARRFNGDLYVLTDRRTYSAAVMFAAAVKDHQLGIIVGEETGGLATQYADIYPFTLPNTGISVLSSHKRIVRPSGADDGRGVLPDDAVEGERALDRALELIAQPRN